MNLWRVLKMTVRLENIDELRRRANVSYEAAKEALEKCNDDIVEALIYLEKNNMARPNTTCEKKSSLWTKFKNLVKKGNVTRLVISKKENLLFSLPVTLAVIITIMAPYLTLIGLAAALFTGHRIKLLSKVVECKQVNEMLDKVSETVECAKKKFVEQSSSTARTN
jgi:hypothetical protein